MVIPCFPRKRWLAIDIYDSKHLSWRLDDAEQPDLKVLQEKSNILDVCDKITIDFIECKSSGVRYVEHDTNFSVNITSVP